MLADPSRRRQAGTLASALLVVLAVALAIVGGRGSGADPLSSPAHLADIADLTELEDSLGHPVYWAGERPGERLELTVEADGNVLLRYLPAGASPGEHPAAFLTVGTYPVPGAQAALRRTARGTGTEVEPLADGSIALGNPDSLGSAYLAYPDSDLQIEVFDPRPGRALSLIRAGTIRPAAEDEG